MIPDVNVDDSGYIFLQHRRPVGTLILLDM